jgi:N-acetylglucosamine-6-sulfatase
MRIPLLLHCPEILRGGTVVNEVVANIDVAPTLLAFAGLVPLLARMDGRSFLPLAQGRKVPWRDALLYEYYWEWNAPYTPTMHALRGERYKYIRYYGIWDTDELYDLQTDPMEKWNLINRASHREMAAELNRKLFDLLEETGGTAIPLSRNRDINFPQRRPDRSPAAPFPPSFLHRGP